MLIYICLFQQPTASGPTGWEPLAHFGDSFGALGTLFSGLAFAGLIATILLQRKDLQLQRTDLQLQRKELKLQREEMEKQSNEFTLQTAQMEEKNFNDAFYLRLGLLDKLFSDITILRLKHDRLYQPEATDQIKTHIEQLPDLRDNIKRSPHDDTTKCLSIEYDEIRCALRSAKDEILTWVMSFFMLVKDIRKHFEGDEPKIEAFFDILINTLTQKKREIIMVFHPILKNEDSHEQWKYIEKKLYLREHSSNTYTQDNLDFFVRFINGSDDTNPEALRDSHKAKISNISKNMVDKSLQDI